MFLFAFPAAISRNTSISRAVRASSVAWSAKSAAISGGMRFCPGTYTQAPLVSYVNPWYPQTIRSPSSPLSDRAAKRYPGVRAYDGRSVVVGVRADNLHLARVRDDLPTLGARLELLEALGSQSMAYFKVDAPTVRPGIDQVDEELEADEEEGGEGVTAARPNFVASFTAEEAVSLRLDEEVPVAVEVGQLHFFDEETGAPLR